MKDQTCPCIELIEQNWALNKTPLVSICCLTYQHEHYIKDAIDGFLKQKTSFKVEILILDDASTDDTADIIKNYESKYPGLIRGIYQKSNQFSQGLQPGNILFNYAKGKYIACCEGDDYWTDPLKLQKQIRFLEKNQDYVLSHTNCDFLNTVSNTLKRSANDNYNILELNTPENRFRSIATGELKIRTASVVFRSDCLKLFKNDQSFIMLDTPLWLNLSQVGKFHYLDKSTVVYRIYSGSLSRPKNIVDHYKFILSGIDMRYYFYQKYNYETPVELSQRYGQTLINYKLLGGKEHGINKVLLTNNSLKKIEIIVSRYKFINIIIFYIKNPMSLLWLIKKTIKFS